MPTSVLGMQSPYFKFHGKDPMISSLEIFGTACYPLLRPYNTTKLAYKYEQCLFGLLQ